MTKSVVSGIQNIYKRVFEFAEEGILIADGHTGRIQDANLCLQKIVGINRRQLTGHKLWEIDAFHGFCRNRDVFDKFFTKTNQHKKKVLLPEKDGRPRYVELASYIFYARGRKFLQMYLRDATEKKRVEANLQRSQQIVHDQEVSLQRKTIALTEILGQLEQEKDKIKKNVLANASEILMPLLKRIRPKRSRKYEEIINKGLADLAASFGLKISKRMYRLTPREIEICSLIRNGMSNKEIAEFLHISVQTVEKHRKDIRKKLYVAHKPVNLATYLQNL